MIALAPSRECHSIEAMTQRARTTRSLKDPLIRTASLLPALVGLNLIASWIVWTPFGYNNHEEFRASIIGLVLPGFVLVAISLRWWLVHSNKAALRRLTLSFNEMAIRATLPFALPFAVVLFIPISMIAEDVFQLILLAVQVLLTSLAFFLVAGVGIESHLRRIKRMRMKRRC